MWQQESESTDGLRPARLRTYAATGGSIGSYAWRGRSLLIGGRGFAGGAAYRLCRVRSGNWGMTIMTALNTKGPSIGRATKVVRAQRRIKSEEAKIQRPNLARNGERMEEE